MFTFVSNVQNNHVSMIGCGICRIDRYSGESNMAELREWHSIDGNLIHCDRSAPITGVSVPSECRQCRRQGSSQCSKWCHQAARTAYVSLLTITVTYISFCWCSLLTIAFRHRHTSSKCVLLMLLAKAKPALPVMSSGRRNSVCFVPLFD